MVHLLSTSAPMVVALHSKTAKVKAQHSLGAENIIYVWREFYYVKVVGMP